jgi:hypothetical protein
VLLAIKRWAIDYRSLTILDQAVGTAGRGELSINKLQTLQTHTEIKNTTWIFEFEIKTSVTLFKSANSVCAKTYKKLWSYETT